MFFISFFSLLENTLPDFLAPIPFFPSKTVDSPTNPHGQPMFFPITEQLTWFKRSRHATKASSNPRARPQSPQQEILFVASQTLAQRPPESPPWVERLENQGKSGLKLKILS